METNLVVPVCNICRIPVEEVGPLAVGTLQCCSHTAAAAGGRTAVLVAT